MMLPIDLIRIYRRLDVLRPRFAKDQLSLAKTVVAVYKDHVGAKRGALDVALGACEELGYDYKLVRGFAAVLESRVVFQASSVVPPLQARTLVFTEASKRVVTTVKDRVEVLGTVARRLGVSVVDLDASLYADLEEEYNIVEFKEPGPGELIRFYNFALTVALLVYSRKMSFQLRNHSEYVEALAETIGDIKTSKRNKTTSLEIALKTTSRVARRGGMIDELLGCVLKSGDWSLRAEIVYPSSSRKRGVFEMSRSSHQELLERDLVEEEFIVEITGNERKPRFGEVINLEELAYRQGKTETSLLKEIREEGFEYKDLGGILLSSKRYEVIKRGLEGVETLRDAGVVLRGHGVRNFVPVLEALGFYIEWRKPRNESRVYRL